MFGSSLSRTLMTTGICLKVGRLCLKTWRVRCFVLATQTAEWDKPQSEFDEDDVLNLEGSEDGSENKDSWTGALLKTSLGGFLHGLTGTKVGLGDLLLPR